MYEVVVTIIAIVIFIAFGLLFVKSGYLNKILVKQGWKSPVKAINWTAFSWESCLVKMKAQADVVFFGDSLIRGGDFQSEFPASDIINLGSSGDTLIGMTGRITTVAALAPKKVFIMGGINSLTDHNLRKCSITYAELVKGLKEALPEAELYFFSLLPISHKKAKKICKNETIIAFNKEIKKIVQDNACTYIDIHTLYLEDGELNKATTKEGIHLNPDGYARWYNTIQQYM